VRAGAELPDDGLSDGIVRVRPWHPDDEDWVFEICSSDREISRWTRVPWPYERAHAREFMAVAPAQLAAGTDASFVITDANDGTRLGAVGLHRIGGEAVGDELPDEVGYWLAADARGRGIATRALLLVSEWAFSTLGRPRLVLQTKQDNQPSRRVAARAGFRRDPALDRPDGECHLVFRRDAPTVG
jgi:RimJ/RimL family protein N-acetyltransferase